MMFLLWSLISTLFSSNLALSFGGTDYRKDGWLSYLAYGGFYGIGYLLFRRKYIFKFLSTSCRWIYLRNIIDYQSRAYQ